MPGRSCSTSRRIISTFRRFERLERALEGYPGAVVLVTHDDTFAAAVTSRSLHVEGGLVV